MENRLTEQEKAELDQLEQEFEDTGGRGVELANRIDFLRGKRDGLSLCQECNNYFDDNPGKEICATCEDWMVHQVTGENLVEGWWVEIQKTRWELWKELDKSKPGSLVSNKDGKEWVKLALPEDLGSRHLEGWWVEIQMGILRHPATVVEQIVLEGTWSLQGPDER